MMKPLRETFFPLLLQRLFHPEPVRGAVWCCKGTMLFVFL